MKPSSRRWKRGTLALVVILLSLLSTSLYSQAQVPLEVVTQSARDITEASAVLSGVTWWLGVCHGCQIQEAWFEVAGNRVRAVGAAGNWSATSTGLTSNTTYTYRLVADLYRPTLAPPGAGALPGFSDHTIVTGNEMTFRTSVGKSAGGTTTAGGSSPQRINPPQGPQPQPTPKLSPSGLETLGPPPKPVAITSPASDVTSTSATLRGVVNPNGSPTTYGFEFSYKPPAITTTMGRKAGAAVGNVAVAEKLTQLQPNTVYHYRIKATSREGTAYGSDVTFTTSKGPLPGAKPSVKTVPLPR
jgi:hypothetical protein